MPRKTPYDDGYDYGDYDDVPQGPRKFKKDKQEPNNKRKPWDRENQYNRHDDYNEE